MDKEKDPKESKKARAERAVLERESRVRAEQAKMQADMNRSRVALSRDEGERVFMCVLPMYPIYLSFFLVIRTGALRCNANSTGFVNTGRCL